MTGVISLDTVATRLKSNGYEVRREFKSEAGITTEWCKPHSPPVMTITSFGQVQEIFVPFDSDSRWLKQDPVLGRNAS